MTMPQSMITTIDNPFNYFTQYDEWLAYDEQKGHHTLEFFDRILKSSNELSQADEAVAIEAAIKEILFFNINGLYRRVTE